MRNRVYGSNQCCCAGGYLHSVPKHYPARSRLRPHEETGKGKSFADVSLDRMNRSSIYALHLTTNVYIYIDTHINTYIYIYIHVYIYIYIHVYYIYIKV